MRLCVLADHEDLPRDHPETAECCMHDENPWEVTIREQRERIRELEVDNIALESLLTAALKEAALRRPGEKGRRMSLADEEAALDALDREPTRRWASKERIVYAAIRWWRSRSPVGWSFRQQLQDPEINLTTDAERELAREIARAMTPMRLRNKPREATDHE